VAPGLEIGWRLVRDAWGQGYASEAARAALADIFAHTDADEVISFTLPTNTRSLAVMARLGLTRDPGRDFAYETGNPAVVFVAPRIRYAAGAEGQS
jgi:ribosomal-protein-alanine N-acetyltransferase